MNLINRWKCYLQALMDNEQAQYKFAHYLKNQSDSENSYYIWLKRSASNGHNDACIEFAKEYIKRQDINSAIEILKWAKPNSTAHAESLLGQILLNQYIEIVDFENITNNTPINTDATGKSQNQIADEVDAYIESLYSDILPKSNKKLAINDIRLKNQILEEALKYLDIGVEKDNVLALHAKAIYLIEYSGKSDEDREKGLSYLNLGIEKGFPPSMQVMAGFYENGLYGYKADISKGLKLRVKASEAGSPEAQYTLGCLIYKGIGFAEHREHGLHLIEMAANKGYRQAIDFLAQEKTRS